jgi:hypothetical protein
LRKEKNRQHGVGEVHSRYATVLLGVAAGPSQFGIGLRLPWRSLPHLRAERAFV